MVNIYTCSGLYAVASIIPKTLNWYLSLFSHSVVSDSSRPHGLQHARLPCPSPSPRACSNSRPSRQWCHPTISSSAAPFSSCPQSFPASVSFPPTLSFNCENRGPLIILSINWDIRGKKAIMHLENRDDILFFSCSKLCIQSSGYKYIGIASK